jgi:hypothetical protein
MFLGCFAMIFFFLLSLFIERLHSLQDVHQTHSADSFSPTIACSERTETLGTRIVELIVSVHQEQSQIVTRQGFHDRRLDSWLLFVDQHLDRGAVDEGTELELELEFEFEFEFEKAVICAQCLSSGALKKCRCLLITILN